jgi:cytochrome c biogenesis protein CcmG/thiol:disulfide interchange protein DsbE
MKSRNIFLLIGGLLLGGLLGILITFGNEIFRDLFLKVHPPMIGKALEDFSLFDTDGNHVSLADFSGKPMVINFWATWCKPCVNEMQLLNDIAQEHPNDLQVIGINVEEDLNLVRQFQEKLAIQFPVLLDSDGKVADQFQIKGYPTSLFVDADGILREMMIGELDDYLLVEYLMKIGIGQ